VIYFTQRGKELPYQLTKPVEKKLLVTQQGISAEDIDACNQVLRKVLENLK